MKYLYALLVLAPIALIDALDPSHGTFAERTRTPLLFAVVRFGDRRRMMLKFARPSANDAGTMLALAVRARQARAEAAAGHRPPGEPRRAADMTRGGANHAQVRRVRYRRGHVGSGHDPRRDVGADRVARHSAD